MSKPLVFAHRGASGSRFENTMKAFKKAYEQGADGIELDVQLSEDGVPFVVHDPELSRVAGVRMPISKMTSAELLKVRVGRKYCRLFTGGHRIPTLMEAVLFCQTHGMALNVELKETVAERPEYIEQIVDIVSLLEDVHISSFDYHSLEKVKEVDATMETAYLIRKNAVDWERLDRYVSADGFHFSQKFLKEPYIGKLTAEGKKIRVYGVTGGELMIANPPSFIDGWITDYPDQFN